VDSLGFKEQKGVEKGAENEDKSRDKGGKSRGMLQNATALVALTLPDVLLSDLT
jgi:hypothetical protein